MTKGPNTPFETLKLIEDMLKLVLVEQDDGRWRYPDKQNDETLAETIGRGATHSAVRKMRIKNHPGGIVVQQIHRRSKKVEEVASPPVEATPEPAQRSIPVKELSERLAAVVAEQVRTALAPVLSDLADIKRLWA